VIFCKIGRGLIFYPHASYLDTVLEATLPHINIYLLLSNMMCVTGKFWSIANRLKPYCSTTCAIINMPYINVIQLVNQDSQ